MCPPGSTNRHSPSSLSGNPPPPYTHLPRLRLPPPPLLAQVADSWAILLFVIMTILTLYIVTVVMTVVRVLLFWAGLSMVVLVVLSGKPLTSIALLGNSCPSDAQADPDFCKDPAFPCHDILPEAPLTCLPPQDNRLQLTILFLLVIVEVLGTAPPPRTRAIHVNGRQTGPHGPRPPSALGLRLMGRGRLKDGVESGGNIGDQPLECGFGSRADGCKTSGPRGGGVATGCQGNPCSTGIRWGVSPAAQMGCLRNSSGSPSGADQP